MGGTVAAVAKLCAHLNGERAKAVHDEFMNDGVRVKAGDKALQEWRERFSAKSCEKCEKCK